MRRHLPALLVVLACARVAFGSCPAAPSLQAPGDGSTVPFGNVQLKWTADAFATSFDVYAALDGDPLSLIGTETGTQKTISVEPGRYVEWKVVAKADSCPPMASAHAMFETNCPNVLPQLRNPDPGDTFGVGDTINFLWTAVPGATSYDVKVTPDFGQTWTDIATDINTTSVSTDDLGEGDWGWQVRANFNGSCTPLYAEPSHFYVTSCANEAPELLEPADGAANVGNPITFKWRSTPGATNYTLYVGADGGTPQPLATTTATQITRTLASGHDIVWSVQAEFGGTTCPPMSSQPFDFTLGGDSGCPANPGKAVLVAPVANATNLASPVTFHWNAVTNASGYRLLIGSGNDEPQALAFTTAETQATVPLPKGSGVWLVQTLFGDDCPTTLSERRNYTVVQGASCSTTAPQLIAPQNNSGNASRTVTFQWSGVTDAIGYSLYVATGGDNEFQLYGATDAHTTQLSRLVPAGQIDWYVLAHFTGCPPAKSSIFRFGSEDACDLATVALNAPANNAETSSPVAFSWGAVPSATEYRLTIRGEGGDSLSQRLNATSASVRLPAGTFFWRVDALRGDCTSSSEERKFVIHEGANCANNPTPTLIAPLGTQAQPAQTTSPVNFQWNAAEGVIAYRIFLSRDGEPFADIGLTTETHKSIELESGDYAWFLQALYQDCVPKSSATSYFRIADTTGCGNQSPQILTPAANASVASPVTITWTAVENAVKYRVLAIVGDVPTLIGTTEETTLTEVIPPGTITISVEAVFRECRSTFAPRVTFNIAQSQNCSSEAPVLAAPANGATNVQPDVDFAWQAVSGALKYALVARFNDGAETVLGTTEETHLLRTLPPGAFRWRVVAFFAGCPPVSSETFGFTIPRAQNCTDRKPVLLFPRNGEDVPSPIGFSWLGVPGANDYRVWVIRRGEQPSIVATTDATDARVELPPGTYRWYVESRFANCPPTFSAQDEFRASEPVACTTPRRPEAHVIGTAVSGVQYSLRWTPLPNVSRYEVQEATALDFANAQSFSVGGLFKRFSHETSGAPVQYLYRVRGIGDCNDAPGPYSQIVGVFIVAPKTNNASAELGEGGTVVQTIQLPGGATALQFTAKTDKPWLHVTPPSGTLPTTGLTLTVTADPSSLGLGTNTGTVQIEYSGASAKGVASNGSTVSTFPMSVSLVTPVTESGKGTPPPDSLIFGAVGHAAGVNGSLFESDIRLTNISAQTMRYDLNFTPSGVDGTQTGSSSSIEVAPGATMALDDIVSSMFGSGDASSLGMLEVRPITTSASSGGIFGSIASSAQELIQTVASSRTYNFTPTGTFGQFIPATRFADFVGRDAVLSLQQVAQSAKQRANFGFLEASGQPANLMVRVYDTANTLLATIPVNLQAMEHRQLNGLLQQNGINDLEDGRVEVEVMSGDGKVTAYVSEIDNATNDPLLVSAVPKGATQADRYIVPGMAYLNTGSAFWVTDLRIFNAATTATAATLTFYPQGNPSAAISRDVTLDPGEIEVMNNVLVNLFGFNTNQGGSIVITTPSLTTLTATARTYNQTTNGTYGQFIPGVTVADSVGLGDRTLQILQVEQSTRIRSNIGLNETTGQPVQVEVSLITPDSLTTPVVTINLAANEYRQIGLVDFHMPDAVYNGRVTVKVVGGAGKVTAYGSAIDQITQDPTYIMAQ